MKVSESLKGHSLICKYREIRSFLHLGCQGANYAYYTLSAMYTKYHNSKKYVFVS